MNIGRLALAVTVAMIGVGCGDEIFPPTPTPTPTPRPFALQPLAAITEGAAGSGAEAKVAFDDSVLLVPLGGGGLALYDLSDRRQPRHISTVGRGILSGQAGSVASANGRAFVATPGAGGLVELDIRSPKDARFVGRFGSNIRQIGQVVLRGHLLFVQALSSSEYLGGVYVFDVAGSPPTLVGQYLVDAVDPGFYVTAGGQAYLARTPPSSTSIDVIDMASPGKPRPVTSWAIRGAGNIFDIDVHGDRVYCAGYWGGVLVLSGAESAQLKTEAAYDWSDASTYSASVAAAPPYVFVARGRDARQPDSLQVFRDSGSSLTPVWEQEASLPVMSVAVSGDLLAVVELESPQMYEPRKRVALYAISGD